MQYVSFEIAQNGVLQNVKPTGPTHFFISSNSVWQNVESLKLKKEFRKVLTLRKLLIANRKKPTICFSLGRC